MKKMCSLGIAGKSLILPIVPGSDIPAQKLVKHKQWFTSLLAPFCPFVSLHGGKKGYQCDSPCHTRDKILAIPLIVFQYTIPKRRITC